MASIIWEKKIHDKIVKDLYGEGKSKDKKDSSASDNSAKNEREQIKRILRR